MLLATETDHTSKGLSEQPIPLVQAVGIFDALADSADIAFGFARAGCCIRAHLMCEEIIRQGLQPKKAWAFEGLYELEVQLPAPQGQVNWWYHVALALPVILPGGEVRELVFDPGLFDGPVTPQQWGAAMGAEENRVEVIAQWAAPKYYAECLRDILSEQGLKAHVESMKSSYLEVQRKDARIVFPSDILKDHQFGPRSGKSWKSVLCLEPPPAEPVKDAKPVAAAQNAPPASQGRVRGLFKHMLGPLVS